MTAPSRHSIERGDVVLSNPPPYSTQPWLSMGVALHTQLLADAGIRARVVRPIDPPFGVPMEVLHASMTTLTFDPTMAERASAMADAYRAVPRFFDRIVDALLEGGEPVVALSVFRNSVDVTLKLAELIKARRPDVIVVIGGPEAIEDPAALLLPFVDVVVGVEAERVLVPLMRALLEGRLADARTLRNVFTHDPGARSPASREALPIPDWPVIDYAPLMRLFVGEPEPTVPLLLNWGCPYHCAYCSNRSIYARFTEGPIGRVLTEMDSVVHAWRALHDGAAPPLSIQLSDATTNALPRQLDTLLEGVAARIDRWGMRPSLRGQTLFDARITDERLDLFDRAGFESTFFGLDVVDDDQRRTLKRPGNLGQVKDAVARYLGRGRAGLGIGIPVGVPGETEAHFEASCAFADWVLSLDAEIQSFTVLPYIFFQSAQGRDLVRLNHGPPRGVLWRSREAAGDPAVRAERVMRLYDHIDGRAPTVCPIPPYLFLPAMLPDADPARLEAWMDRHGRIFDQIEPGDAPVVPAHETPEGKWARALDALRLEPAPWDFETYEHHGERLTVVFRGPGGEARLALQLEPRDPERRSFSHTSEFNVSYLKSWQGITCQFDEAWVQHRIHALRTSEAR